MLLWRDPLAGKGRSARRLHVPLSGLSAVHRNHLQRARLLLQELREDRRLSQVIPPNCGVGACHRVLLLSGLRLDRVLETSPERRIAGGNKEPRGGNAMGQELKEEVLATYSAYLDAFRANDVPALNKLIRYP